MTAALTWGMTLILLTMAVVTMGPHVEARLWPAARGELISWREVGGEIEITEARIWKRSSTCQYITMHARAGVEDLPWRATQEFGSRPGGEFVLRGIYIRKPPTPTPIRIQMTVDHICFPFWVSHSQLFTIDWQE